MVYVHDLKEENLQAQEGVHPNLLRSQKANACNPLYFSQHGEDSDTGNMKQFVYETFIIRIRELTGKIGIRLKGTQVEK